MPLLAAAALILAIAGEAPASGPSADLRWLGIAFGSAAVIYRPRLGDPLRVTALIEPPERKARYLISRAPMVFLLVTERNGAVVGIETFSDAALPGPVLGVEADPNGIRLGASLAEVAAARPGARRYTDSDGDVHLQEDVDAGRGLLADYRFANERLVADTWLTKSDVVPPQLPGALPLAEAQGESESSAILDVQATQTAGVDWEYLYLRFHRCDASQSWRPGSQHVSQAHGRTFDVLETTCRSTGAKRTFYFDITAFFGRL